MNGRSFQAVPKLFVGLLVLVAGSMVAADKNRIEELTVVAKQSQYRSLISGVSQEEENLLQKKPMALTDLLSDIPAVGIRTNSRGEATVRVRGSEERQSRVFLDGAPLDVPWDGRVDLSSLPSSIIRKVTVRTSVAPVEFGPNAVLGIVDLQTKVDCPSGLCSVRLDFGDGQSRYVDALAGKSFGNSDLLAAVSFTARDGWVVPAATRDDPSALLHVPPADSLQQNTDFRGKSLWTAYAHGTTRFQQRVSLLSSSSSRGISPAGHLDPASGNPRYWRYPDWEFNLLTHNSQLEISQSLNVRSTLWVQDFEQQIDQYTSATYETLDESELNWDSARGLRLVSQIDLAKFGVRTVLNHQESTHKQAFRAADDSWRSKRERFSQHLSSLGIEFDFASGSGDTWSLSFSRDVASTPETSGRVPQKTLGAWAGSLSHVKDLSRSLSVRTSLGQRTRFPTLRELYGVALGKFLHNPNLLPETAACIDSQFDWQLSSSPIMIYATPWRCKVDDTLTQQRVNVDGRLLRQRVNETGSTSEGIDVGFDWTVASYFSVRFGATAQSFRAELSQQGTRPYILQKPEFKSQATFTWGANSRWFFQLKHLHTSGALDEEPSGQVITLGSTNQVDLSMDFKLPLHTLENASVHFHARNITDETVLPQLGLPAPGRTLQVGFTYNIK